MSPFTLAVCRADGCSGHPCGHPPDPAADLDPHRATGAPPSPAPPAGNAPPGPSSPSPAPPSPAPPIPTPPGEAGPSPMVRTLSEATRRSEHGVLVVTGCLLGTLCRSCGPAAAGSAGRVVLVQPCDRSREPSGPAVLVGPIRDPADADALCNWLRSGSLTAQRLPDRLRGYERTLRRGSPN